MTEGHLHVCVEPFGHVMFMFFNKATKIDEIFTVDLTLCSKCQIDGEDFVKFCGLLIKHEIYVKMLTKYPYRIQNSRSKSKDGLFDFKSE